MESGIKNYRSIVLFDGVCNFCNSSVNFIIRHDPRMQFKFATLQSVHGVELCKQYNIDTTTIDSIVLIQDDSAYIKSSAILLIMKRLNYLYPLLYGFIVIPRFLRDPVYDLIAKNRYRWFGKKDSCMIPTEKIKQRFIF